GNGKIISLLLRYPAYQQDIQGIEEAIEIVASRLRGLKPGTPEFKKYKAIFEGLTREHKEILLKILAGAGRTNEEELAPIQNLPPELQHYIVQLTTPQAYAAVFPHGNMK
ncbi:MAG TPA: hypothetical protein VHA52_09500, partial [Candidatus Babeliaceae bacterium]|nr:hypothetical protein [Candidatus Babeliaceae bacterium]